MSFRVAQQAADHFIDWLVRYNHGGRINQLAPTSKTIEELMFERIVQDAEIRIMAILNMVPETGENLPKLNY